MMRYQQHLNFAHNLWKDLLQPHDLAIDATCGNGHDTLFLAPLVKKLYAIDIQEKALENAKKNLGETFSHVFFIQGSHEKFPEEITPNSVKLIVYNLGYLPGGDKMVTTVVTSTLLSIQESMELIIKGGLISITCYPGHLEGEKEEKAILLFVSSLDPKKWGVSYQQWINRDKAPSLFLIYKLI